MERKMIPLNIRLFVMILLGLVLLQPAAGICFTAMAQVDETRLAPGERVSLQVVVDGGKAEVDLSPIRDFDIVSSGTSTSRSYNNGQWQHQVIYRYLLVPVKTGKLRIPPLIVSQGKQIITTKEIQILVSQTPQSQAQSKQLFVEAHVQASDLVVGQQTVYTVKLFAAARFARASLKTPAFDSFAVRELEERKNYTQTVNGIPYLVNEIYYILQAEKPGKFEIGPAVIMADLIQRSGSDPVDSFFNDSFFSSARTKSVQVASNGVTLGVSPLPTYEGDNPFSGLVGQFTMGAAIDKGQIAAGDSATLTITIQGKGNIMDAGPPPLNLDPGLVKVYDDTPTEEMTATSIGFSGKKTFKSALVPRQPGVVVIPPVFLTYFDVDDRDYKRVSTNEISIDVIGAPILTTDGPGDNPGSGAADPAGSAIQQQEVVMVNKDILDIKDSVSILSTPFKFDFSLFVLLVIAPGLLYGGIALAFRFQTREKSNETLMGQRAVRSLKTAEKLAGENLPFLNHVQSSLVAAILAKGNKQGESLTCGEARQILQHAGTDPGIIDQAVVLLETLDATRFGGQQIDTSQAQFSPGRVKQIIKMLSILLCCIGLFIHSPSPAFANTALANAAFANAALAKDKIGKAGGVDLTEPADLSDSVVPGLPDLTGPFINGIKQYRAGEFKDAAASFKRLAASGVVNPDLFYNIGNAYLKSNDLGHAILWYERAKRLSPGNPDLLFNLAHANSLVKDKIDTSVTLTDILFFWKGVVSLKWIQTGAIVFSWLFFLWAGGQALRQKSVFSGPGWVLLSLLVLMLLAAGMEDYRGRAENLAVIVQDAVPVRSGIMETSTELFELNAGTRVQVKAKKNGYLKIRLTKGRVGWVKPGDAEVI